MKEIRLTHFMHYARTQLSVLAGLMLLVVSINTAGAATEEPRKLLAKADPLRLVLSADYQQSTNASDFFIVDFRVCKEGTVVHPRILASTQPNLRQAVLNQVAKAC